MHAHEQGRPVGVCGEAASDPTAASLFVGLGVDELSLAPGLIPKIKESIRRIARRDMEALAAEAQELATAAEVRALWPENCKDQPTAGPGKSGRSSQAMLGRAFALAKGTSWCPMRLERRVRFNQRAYLEDEILHPIAAALIAVLNALLLIPAMTAYTVPIAAFALLLAIAILALSLFRAAKFRRPRRHPSPPNLLLPRPNVRLRLKLLPSWASSGKRPPRGFPHG